MSGAALPVDAAQAQAPARPIRWIVGPKYDLFFFVLSGVLVFAFYGLYVLAQQWGLEPRGESVLLTYFLFTALFDHPHIFQSFSRTHFDRDEFKRRKKLYTWGLGGFVVVGLVVTGLGYEAELIVFASVFGTWHIIRQHYGMMRAYKVLNEDMQPLDNWLDALLLYFGCFACFFHDYEDIRGPVQIYGDLRANFPSLPPDIGAIVWNMFLVLAVAWGLRMVWRAGQGRAPNWPKLLLLAAALSTHYFVFFVAAVPFLVAEAIETVYHDVQYQGWVMHYQRKRFPKVKRVVLKWFAIAMIYGLIVGALEVAGFLGMRWAVWLFVPFTMCVIFHYYVDGLIWRFRDYPELREMLKR